ncbi:MAG: hypothetical protein R3B99_11780 [Polyangiales bacterium]
MSLADLAAIRETAPDASSRSSCTALCIAYSGQCLTSRPSSATRTAQGLRAQAAACPTTS